jgi:hypothetical protein
MAGRYREIAIPAGLGVVSEDSRASAESTIQQVSFQVNVSDKGRNRDPGGATTQLRKGVTGHKSIDSDKSTVS